MLVNAVCWPGPKKVGLICCAPGLMQGIISNAPGAMIYIQPPLGGGGSSQTSSNVGGCWQARAIAAAHANIAERPLCKHLEKPCAPTAAHDISRKSSKLLELSVDVKKPCALTAAHGGLTAIYHHLSLGVLKRPPHQCPSMDGCMTGSGHPRRVGPALADGEGVMAQLAAAVEHYVPAPDRSSSHVLSL